MVENVQESAVNDDHRFHDRATRDSHMSWMRTRLSAERTMMSWIRTAVSLIGFGFTIVQFFERFSAFSDVAPADRPWAPRYIGLALIGVGILSLTISAIEYRRVLVYIRGKEFTQIAGVSRKPWVTPIYFITVTLIIVGLFAFFAIVFRAI